MGRLTGVDIGSHAAKVVRLGWRGRPGVAALFPLARGAVADGAVSDPAAVAASLRAHGRLRGGAVIGVSHQQGVARIMRLPAMSEGELDAALAFELPKLTPWAGEAVCSDRLVLQRHGREMEVLVGLARRTAVEGAMAACREAGLVVRGADLEAMAILRALQALGLVDPGWEGAFAAADLGASACKVTIFQGGVPASTRVVAPGGQELTRALAERLGVDEARAEELKVTRGLEDGDVAEALSPLCDRLLAEIWRSLEFHLLLNPGLELHRVFCIGGTAALPGLVRRLDGYLRERMASRLGRGTEGPLAEVVIPRDAAGGRHASGRARLDSRFVVALGLALWRE